MARRFVLAFAAAVLTLFGSASFAQEAVLDDLYGRGVHAFFAGSSREAHDLLTAAINGGSRDPRAYFYRGLIYMRMGRPEDANLDFQKGTELEVLGAQVNLEDPQVTYETTHALLEKHSDLAGIYSAGGGMEGAIGALRESGRAREVMLVVNEITDETREALQDGTVKIVVGTPLHQLCAELIPLMIHAVERGMAETPGQRFLPFEIWTPESL